MAEDLRAPGLAYQIIMHEYAAMCFEFCACLQVYDEVFMTQANEFSKVTIARNGGWGGE